MENKTEIAAKSRFATTSTQEKLKLMEDKNAKNTNRATKSSITALNDYIKEKNLKPLEQTGNDELPDLVENFYCDARTKNDVPEQVF